MQPALGEYAARRAREDRELDLLRGRAAVIALGSGGGVDLTLALTRAQANLQQVNRRAVVLRRGVSNPAGFATFCLCRDVFATLK